MDIINPEMWKQEWTAFQSAPFIMLAGIMVVGAVAWWLSGTRFSGKIAGLEGQISVLNERLRLAADKLVAAGTATGEVERRFKILEDAIAAKAENAELVALSSQMQSAVGEWGKAQTAVSNAVRPSIYDLAGHIYPRSRKRPPTAAEMGLGSLVSPEDWEKIRDVVAPQKPDRK